MIDFEVQIRYAPRGYQIFIQPILTGLCAAFVLHSPFFIFCSGMHFISSTNPITASFLLIPHPTNCLHSRQHTVLSHTLYSTHLLLLSKTPQLYSIPPPIFWCSSHNMVFRGLLLFDFATWISKALFGEATDSPLNLWSSITKMWSVHPWVQIGYFCQVQRVFFEAFLWDCTHGQNLVLWGQHGLDFWAQLNVFA